VKSLVHDANNMQDKADSRINYHHSEMIAPTTPVLFS